jgi:hypothetical protein
VTQQIQPDGSLEFFEHDGTLDLAKRIIREFDYHGIAHFDMRIASDDSSLMAIECNPRFWYSMPASLWRGVNFVAAGVQYATQGGVSDVPRISPGKYFLPGSLISFLRNPLNVRKLDWQNIRGVLQPALDPVPHLIDLCRKKF